MIHKIFDPPMLTLLGISLLTIPIHIALSSVASILAIIYTSIKIYKEIKQRKHDS